MATSQKALTGVALDPAWHPFIAKLIVNTRATVVPVYFAGQNSRLFQIASHLNYTARLALLFRETARRIGSRIVGLQQVLGARVEELQQALANVRKLGGLLPICAYCKRIRDDRDYWRQIEHFVTEHSDVKFSHGICPECIEAYVNKELPAARS